MGQVLIWSIAYILSARRMTRPLLFSYILPSTDTILATRREPARAKPCTSIFHAPISPSNFSLFLLLWFSRPPLQNDTCQLCLTVTPYALAFVSIAPSPAYHLRLRHPPSPSPSRCLHVCKVPAPLKALAHFVTDQKRDFEKVTGFHVASIKSKYMLHDTY